MSDDGLEIVRRLVDVVARTFYKDEHIIALDYLNRHEIARTDVLSRYLHVKPKEVHKIYNELEKHRLVKVMVRSDEPTDNNIYQRRGKQRYYYIDYKQFVDVVKWRMYKLQEQVRSGMDKEQENLGYDCVRCTRRFTILEAVSLRDMSTDQFRCDYCGDELVDHTSMELVQESQKEYSRIMDQFKTIVDLLYQTDSITLPAPMQLSQVPVPDMENLDANDGKGRPGGKELGVARDTGAASGDTIIEFAPDLTPKEAARIRESELEKKLRQNALPAWHMWSSVSGVQMVPDQKITPEAALKHQRHVERRNYLKNRWNKRGRERAKAALLELDKQARSGTSAVSAKQTGDDEAEASREAFYAKFYTDVAQKSNVALPRDPRENYKKLLAQLTKNEEIERAEMEKRKLEQERIEKERKEAAAAAAASAYGDRNNANALKFRGRYNNHGSYNRFGRGSNRRRMTHRLFEFVGAELADAGSSEVAQSSAEAGEHNSNEAVAADDNNAKDSVAQMDDSAGHGDDKMQLADGDAQDDEPDPYIEGIYALSQAKRRKLGLDDEAEAELADSGSDTATELPQRLAEVSISVGGHSKAIGLVTSEDENIMSTNEYIAYWNAWHREQGGMARAA
ncbi:hypothetical protein LPJ58_003590 [Coemansia sp. RSA 1591]|nr:hypothetical protein LPJ58_003590 [Coemansia sp. RSA 1591]KAJ1786643.1 hypothetical protein LPJ67_003499 [Coemansia sp. RSA 1938]